MGALSCYWTFTGPLSSPSGIYEVYISYQMGDFNEAIPPYVLMSVCYIIHILMFFVFPLILTIASYICINFLINTIYKFNNENVPHALTPKKLYLYLLPIILLTIIYVGSALPSYRQPDYITIMRGWENNTINLWHPFFYQMVMRAVYSIFHTSWAFIIIQGLIWIYLSRRSILTLYELTMSEKALKWYVLLSCCILTPYIYLQVPYKDPLFCMALYGICIQLMRFVVIKHINYVETGFWGIIVCSFRHGGSLALILALALIIIIELLAKNFSISTKKLGGITLGLIIFTFSVNSLIPSLLQAIPNKDYVKYSVALSMISGIAASDANISDEDLQRMEQIMPREEWADCYNPYYADDSSRTWGKIGNNVNKIEELDFGKDIITLNWHFLTQFPFYYLRNFSANASIIWEICSPSDNNEWAIAFSQQPTMAEDYHFHSTGFSKFSTALTNFAHMAPIYHDIVWRGGLSFFILLIIFIKYIINKKAGRILAGLPIILYTAELFFTIPCPDPRYILYLLEFCPFLLIYSIFENNN